MRRRSALVVVLVLGLLSSGIAMAGRGLTTRQFAYPGYEAQWHKGEGVPDGSKTQWGLHLEKVDPAASDPADGSAGVGVAIVPVDGITLSELGFDLRNDGLGFCGTVFPRFRVITTDGVLYHFPCKKGVLTTSPDDPANWTRIRFMPGSSEPEVPAFVFGMTTIQYLAVGFRLGVEQTGAIHLDNLDVNGTLIGKPGRN